MGKLLSSSSSSLSSPRANNGKPKKGTKLRVVMQKLQRSFLLVGKMRSSSSSSAIRRFDELDNSIGRNGSVPEDVKEGHFAVMAVDEEDEEEMKRFVVPLACLAHPSFVKLLERAAEEYGFERDGAIMVPCKPSELERILAEQWVEQLLALEDIN
ncbi:unnamed protein product [Cuscuta campestris]|uniref:Uncharacterized protein n=1 Tax=Cuscuta campestris TaxID=132261 RepID=A0A484LY63_9ASTE|nr:unnamed protein product [Cuscuta campestris]